MPTPDEALNEPRLVAETGTDQRIAAIIEPVIGSMGYRLVRVRITGQSGVTLQIMAERPDGTMSVEDCEAVSHAISPVLDVEDPIDKAYNLEVSSPGIDRPMVRRSDFARWVGHLVKCETSVMLAGGHKRFRGTIARVDDDGFAIDRDQPPADEPASVAVPFSALAEAKLILTDELVREALKADKEAKAHAANQNDADEVSDNE